MFGFVHLPETFSLIGAMVKVVKLQICDDALLTFTNYIILGCTLVLVIAVSTYNISSASIISFGGRLRFFSCGWNTK